MVYLKKTNAFLVNVICFSETVHEKWCLDKSVLQSENGLEHGFVKTLAKLHLKNWPCEFFLVPFSSTCILKSILAKGPASCFKAIVERKTPWENYISFPNHHSIAIAPKYAAFWQRLARVSSVPHLDLNICKTTTTLVKQQVVDICALGPEEKLKYQTDWTWSRLQISDKKVNGAGGQNKTWKHFEQIFPIFVTLPNAETSNFATIFFFAHFPTINKEDTENWQINPFKVGEQGRQGEAKTFFLSYNCRIARFCETFCSTE